MSARRTRSDGEGERAAVLSFARFCTGQRVRFLLPIGRLIMRQLNNMASQRGSFEAFT